MPCVCVWGGRAPGGSGAALGESGPKGRGDPSRGGAALRGRGPRGAVQGGRGPRGAVQGGGAQGGRPCSMRRRARPGTCPV